jgi:hypothetical protein
MTPTPKLRRALWILGAVALLIVAWPRPRFPSDQTPEGAYLRIALAINRREAQDFFAYLETPAQHACFSIGQYRRQAKERILQAFPEAERKRALELLEPHASRPDGPLVFVDYAAREGWIDRLRRDLSGVGTVEIEDQRATVQTVRGTRYPFRRRENGIWGITLFTPLLVSEAERAARDFALIDAAARDYEHASRQGVTSK